MINGATIRGFIRIIAVGFVYEYLSVKTYKNHRLFFFFMGQFDFKFPDVGEGIHEGTIVKWLVKKGDKVKPDQILAEVETDKAVV